MSEVDTIRNATVEDLDAIVRMGQRFLTSSTYARLLEENPAQMRRFAEQLLKRPDGHILIAERDGEAVGMVAFYVFPHFYSGEMMAGELIWWVEPEHRAGRVGLKLLRIMEELAKTLGCVKMQMIAPNERIGELYRRLGYVWVEETYQRSLT